MRVKLLQPHLIALKQNTFGQFLIWIKPISIDMLFIWRKTNRKVSLETSYFTASFATGIG